MAYLCWLDSSGITLGPQFPLPLDLPFTRGEAIQAGIAPRVLQTMVQAGLLRKVLHGVYAAAQAPDSIRFRAAAAALVVPAWAVVTDRAAGWIHGMPVLRRGAHREPPTIEVCHRSDSRTIRPELDGHRRQLLDTDVVVIGGVQLTTAIRTALDLGRMLWQFDAIAALDAALAIGVDHDGLLSEIGRFKGFRGVRQLRWLAPLADPRSESPGESALRLHWVIAGLPAPVPQLWVYDDDGVGIYRLDLTLPEVRYAAEYDGESFHTSERDRQYDADRRDWLHRHRHWSIDPFVNDDVYRPGTKIQDRLVEGFVAARRRSALWTP